MLRLTAALVMLLHGSARGAPADPPRLLVVLVVDQMRADYVDWYGAQWKGGLRRLYDQGAWLKNARYPFLNTITCPGHFTIATGANPHRHGMILNSWYDRQRKKIVDCTDDPAATLVGYPPPPAPLAGGDSARNLLVPTLADELVAQLPTRPQLASLSLKARSAVGLAGHGPGVVLWFDGQRFVTSRAFAPSPTPWVGRFVTANPIAVGGPWERMLPASAYLHEDEGAGENPWPGTKRVFPHVIRNPSGSPFARWVGSPASSEHLALMARSALAEMKLGQGPGTDLLAVSFSNTDLVGHKFGPRSHEVQDAFIRLDATIGGLLEALDRQVAGNYVVALTADHGVAPMPEQTPGGGRLLLPELKKQVQTAITAALGPGEHVAEAIANDLYLADGVFGRLIAKRGALGRVRADLRKVPGVGDVLDGRTLDVAKARGPVQRAAALSYHPGRSGDLVIVPRPNWVVGELGTNHGSIQDYDQRVPVIFFGKGIQPGRYSRAVTPADIAPTLAHLVGVKMPRAEGKPIREVMARSPQGAGAK